MKFAHLSPKAKQLALETVYPMQDWDSDQGFYGYPARGVTKRELFAKDAMESIVNTHKAENIDPTLLSQKAVGLANSLCQALVDDEASK